MSLASVCSSKVVEPFDIEFGVGICISRVTFMAIHMGCMWLKLQLGYLWMTIKMMKDHRKIDI